MKRIEVVLLVVILVIIGCSKSTDPVVNPPVDPPPGDNDPAFQDLNIAANFDFSSTKDVELDIILPSFIDYTTVKSKIAIYYLHNEQQYLVSSVSCDLNGRYQGTHTVPSYISELLIVNEAGSINVSIAEAGLKSSTTVNYDDSYENTAPRDTVVETKNSLISNIVAKASYGKLGVSELKAVANIIGNGDFSENDFGTQTHWNSAMTVDGKWYITSQLNGVAGQFNDNGNPILKITRPNAYRYGGVAQLVDGAPGDRITFSADLKIVNSSYKRVWLYIIPRNSSGNPIAYYSRHVSSTGGDWRNYSVAATMPNGTASVEILLWQHIYGGEIHWDNVVVTGPVQDGDGDGINDDEDDYPNDALRAFNNYYPSSETYFSVAFEDNWPGRGDYDFNDMVVDCQYKTVTNASNAVKDLDINLIYRAIGATFQNGLGFEFNTTPANVLSVAGQTITGTLVSLGTNGVETGQSKAVVIATDNAFNKLTHPGSGIGVNTTVGAPYVDPVLQSIEVRFDDAVSASDMGTAPYNPFLIVNQDRGREIHLPDKTPTDLADVSYFGTQHDDTQSGNGKYYKTTNNLPWAISIPTTFVYPNEKTDIINAHLKFSDWAESSGEQFPDWYLDKTGYRNSGNIYQTPN